MADNRRGSTYLDPAAGLGGAPTSPSHNSNRLSFVGMIQRTPSGGSSKKKSEATEGLWASHYRKEATYEGYLLKQGREGTFLPSKFERRYLILHRSSLFYFRRKEDEPIGLIHLRGAAVTRDPSSQPGRVVISINANASVNFESQKCFNRRMYVFIAEADDEGAVWLSHITAAAQTAGLPRSQSGELYVAEDESRTRSGTSNSFGTRADSLGSGSSETPAQNASLRAEEPPSGESAASSRSGSAFPSRSGSTTEIAVPFKRQGSSASVDGTRNPLESQVCEALSVDASRYKPVEQDVNAVNAAATEIESLMSRVDVPDAIFHVPSVAATVSAGRACLARAEAAIALLPETSALRVFVAKQCAPVRDEMLLSIGLAAKSLKDFLVELSQSEIPVTSPLVVRRSEHTLNLLNRIRQLAVAMSDIEEMASAAQFLGELLPKVKESRPAESGRVYTIIDYVVEALNIALPAVDENAKTHFVDVTTPLIVMAGKVVKALGEPAAEAALTGATAEETKQLRARLTAQIAELIRTTRIAVGVWPPPRARMDMLRFIFGVACGTLHLVGATQKCPPLWSLLVLDLDDLPQLHIERTESVAGVTPRKRSDAPKLSSDGTADGEDMVAVRKSSDAAAALAQVDVIRRIRDELDINKLIIQDVRSYATMVKEGVARLLKAVEAEDRATAIATTDLVLDAVSSIMQQIDPMELNQVYIDVKERWGLCKKDLHDAMRDLRKHRGDATFGSEAEYALQYEFALSYLSSAGKVVREKTGALFDVAEQVMAVQQEQIDLHQKDIEHHQKKIERARGKMTALDDLYKNIIVTTEKDKADAKAGPATPTGRPSLPRKESNESLLPRSGSQDSLGVRKGSQESQLQRGASQDRLLLRKGSQDSLALPDEPPPVPPLPPAPRAKAGSESDSTGDKLSLSTSSSMTQLSAAAGGTGTVRGGVKKPEPKAEEEEFDPTQLVLDDTQTTISGHRLVKGGTLERLVERLTHEKSFDPHFPTTFMLTYRSFTTPMHLLDLLVERCIAAGKEESEQTMIRLRVFNALKLWINSNWDDFKSDPSLLDKINVVIPIMEENKLRSAAKQLQDMIKAKTLNASQKQRKHVFDSKAPQPILPPEIRSADQIKSFLDIDPLEIARQLTLIESGLFALIQPKECLDLAWQAKNNRELAPDILGMIERSNRVSNWVATEILKEETLKGRANIMRHIINIAEKCRSLNNFNCVMAIIAGLTNAAIFRMKKTWEALPSKTQTQWTEIKTLMSEQGNFSRYRQELHSINPPVIPFLGIYLTDLVMIETGNKNQITNTTLINFDKRRKIATVIQEIQRYQQTPYHLQEVDFLRQYLLDVQVLDPNAMYERSLVLEPREKGPPAAIPAQVLNSPSSRKGSLADAFRRDA